MYRAVLCVKIGLLLVRRIDLSKKCTRIIKLRAMYKLTTNEFHYYNGEIEKCEKYGIYLFIYLYLICVE